jgi:predicted RNA-binding protein with RPS1 domain
MQLLGKTVIALACLNLAGCHPAKSHEAEAKARGELSRLLLSGFKGPNTQVSEEHSRKHGGRSYGVNPTDAGPVTSVNARGIVGNQWKNTVKQTGRVNADPRFYRENGVDSILNLRDDYETSSFYDRPEEGQYDAMWEAIQKQWDEIGFVYGEVSTGVVKRFTSDGGKGVLVDIGLGPEVQLNKDQLSLGKRKKARFLHRRGDEIRVNVDWDYRGDMMMERASLIEEEICEKIYDAYETGKIVDVVVEETFEAGAVGHHNSAEGFLPRSHIQATGGGEDGEDLDFLLGKTLPCKVLDVQDNDGMLKITYSNRMALQEMQKDIISNLTRGTLVTGKVAGRQPYGLFVQLDAGPTAFLHVSQLSNGMVSIDDFPMNVGDPIKAIVTTVDNIKGQIQLSTKVLEKPEEKGLMMVDPQKVFANAEEMVGVFAERAAAQAKENEKLAKQFLEQFGGDSMMEEDDDDE